MAEACIVQFPTNVKDDVYIHMKPSHDTEVIMIVNDNEGPIGDLQNCHSYRCKFDQAIAIFFVTNFLYLIIEDSCS